MESDEAILRIENFFESLMDAVEKLVKVGGLVEGVNNFGDDLALGFHAVKVGNVEIGDDDAFDGGIVCAIAAKNIEPAPGSVFGAQAAAAADFMAGSGTQFGETLADFGGVIAVDKRDKRNAMQIFGAIAENFGESLIHVLDEAIWSENGYKFAKRFKQGRILPRSDGEGLGEGRWMGHFV